MAKVKAKAVDAGKKKPVKAARVKVLNEIRRCSLSEQPQYYRCSPLVGSRLAVANVELRFPLFRRVDIGLLPLSLPPIEGLVFYDVGLTWFEGQNLHWSRPTGFDPAWSRYARA